MPDRIIRDEILSSERYWSVSNDSKLLFLHILLVADDFGNAHGSHFSLRTKCFAGHQVENAVIDRLLDQLVAVDLVRLYEVDEVRYVHIPRFRQRLRHVKRVYPISPWHTNNELAEKTPDARQTHVGRTSAEEKRREEKGREDINLSGSLRSPVSEGDGLALTPKDQTTTLSKKSLPARAKNRKTAKTAETWSAYSAAYQDRYHVEPVRNAKANRLLCTLIERIGNEEAPAVAHFYLSHNRGLYASSGHCLDLLVRDAEKLRTEWATGRRVTETQARQGDRTQALGDVFNELIEEERERNGK